MSVKDFSQFVQFNPALFDHLAELGQTLGAQLEKITRLQFDAGLASTQEALAASRALLEVRDPSALLQWQEAHVKPGFERAAASAREQYEVLVETRDILAAAVHQAATDATRQMQANIERLAEGAPEGLGLVFDAFRKSLDAQIAAMDNMNKVGAQIQDITDTNLLAIKRAVETSAAAPVAAKRKAA
ncbi:MAG: phasin family protein [Zoogloea sp.]|jgi:phasin family protein|uniref:phasin family protein n=1 Tax=Zoogloea sp. TaxID=49181 RepID=UPI0026374ECA|nr:phasin family protein [Zoogloea sp.]MDD3326621.1 phasin family protein [Zoogloea sp.]